MITPSFALTATERVLPKLALDFTTASLDSRVTFTRSGNTATVINSSGVIVAINADLPRFDFNPTTLVCRGLLIEEARTNALLNSLIDGTDLATQLVTVTAAARTLSFYGTGTVVLSGAHSATVVGTGAYPARTTLTFTPSAGVLTLTVTGTVQFAQLETGAFATSFIPTAATAVTRNADVATMTGTNFSDWYNATEGSLYTKGNTVDNVNFPGFATIGRSDNSSNFMSILNSASSANILAEGTVSGSAQFGISRAGNAKPNVNNGVLSYKANNFIFAANGNTTANDVTGSIPTVDQLKIGRLNGNNNYLNGAIQKIMYWPQAFTASEVQAFSK